MEHPENKSVVFDYTSFLGASCTKKWTFLEAFSTLIPKINLTWHYPQAPCLAIEERLWARAMHELSAHHSDESNLLILMQLARNEGIDELTLVMPYPLDPEQITTLQSDARSDIQCGPHDQLQIRLSTM
ncbi:transporter [Vibrio ostreicida]|uniref:Transporter n=1 Tax=Vibrio ostreicida TaxID=526588 RepID=A0ABT8BU20_9VIBR|nr:transporter [Vibrio ostreicida]MDN3610257.1 transporter [Vibrio ostreicida]NPD07726.1 transporter [Vibrio ostreicida]